MDRLRAGGKENLGDERHAAQQLARIAAVELVEDDRSPTAARLDDAATRLVGDEKTARGDARVLRDLFLAGRAECMALTQDDPRDRRRNLDHDVVALRKVVDEVRLQGASPGVEILFEV